MSKAIVEGKLVDVVVVNGGWTTYVDHNGATRKIRNSQVNSTPADVAALEALAEAGDTTAQDKLIAASDKNHPVMDLDATFKCDRCETEFLSQEALDEHIAEHDAPKKPRSSMVMLVAGGAKSAEVLERRAAAKEQKRIEENTKKPRITRANLLTITCCPECGSKEIYFGHAPQGMVINEDTVAGCHDCDWEVDFTDKEAKVVPDMTRYTVGKGTTVTGRKTIDIDDYVADKLRGLDLEDIYNYVAAVLAELNVEYIGTGSKKMHCGLGDLKARYNHLNVGMQRMNLGNLLRGTMRRLGMETLPEVDA